MVRGPENKTWRKLEGEQPAASRTDRVTRKEERHVNNGVKMVGLG